MFYFEFFIIVSPTQNAMTIFNESPLFSCSKALTLLVVTGASTLSFCTDTSQIHSRFKLCNFDNPQNLHKLVQDSVQLHIIQLATAKMHTYIESSFEHSAWFVERMKKCSYSYTSPLGRVQFEDLGKCVQRDVFMCVGFPNLLCYYMK